MPYRIIWDNGEESGTFSTLYPTFEEAKSQGETIIKAWIAKLPSREEALKYEFLIIETPGASRLH